MEYIKTEILHRKTYLIYEATLIRDMYEETPIVIGVKPTVRYNYEDTRKLLSPESLGVHLLFAEKDRLLKYSVC